MFLKRIIFLLFLSVFLSPDILKVHGIKVSVFEDGSSNTSESSHTKAGENTISSRAIRPSGLSGTIGLDLRKQSQCVKGKGGCIKLKNGEERTSHESNENSHRLERGGMEANNEASHKSSLLELLIMKQKFKAARRMLKLKKDNKSKQDKTITSESSKRTHPKSDKHSNPEKKSTNSSILTTFRLDSQYKSNNSFEIVAQEETKKGSRGISLSSLNSTTSASSALSNQSININSNEKVDHAVTKKRVSDGSVRASTNSNSLPEVNHNSSSEIHQSSPHDTVNSGSKGGKSLDFESKVKSITDVKVNNNSKNYPEGKANAEIKKNSSDLASSSSPSLPSTPPKTTEKRKKSKFSEDGLNTTADENRTASDSSDSSTSISNITNSLISSRKSNRNESFSPNDHLGEEKIGNNDERKTKIARSGTLDYPDSEKSSNKRKKKGGGARKGKNKANENIIDKSVSNVDYNEQKKDEGKTVVENHTVESKYMAEKLTGEKDSSKLIKSSTGVSGKNETNEKTLDSINETNLGHDHEGSGEVNGNEHAILLADDDENSGKSRADNLNSETNGDDENRGKSRADNFNSETKGDDEIPEDKEKEISEKEDDEHLQTDDLKKVEYEIPDKNKVIGSEVEKQVDRQFVNESLESQEDNAGDENSALVNEETKAKEHVSADGTEKLGNKFSYKSSEFQENKIVEDENNSLVNGEGKQKKRVGDENSEFVDTDGLVDVNNTSMGEKQGAKRGSEMKDLDGNGDNDAKSDFEGTNVKRDDDRKNDAEMNNGETHGIGNGDSDNVIENNIDGEKNNIEKGEVDDSNAIEKNKTNQGLDDERSQSKIDNSNDESYDDGDKDLKNEQESERHKSDEEKFGYNQIIFNATDRNSMDLRGTEHSESEKDNGSNGMKDVNKDSDGAATNDFNDDDDDSSESTEDKPQPINSFKSDKIERESKIGEIEDNSLKDANEQEDDSAANEFKDNGNDGSDDKDDEVQSMQNINGLKESQMESIYSREKPPIQLTDDRIDIQRQGPKHQQQEGGEEGKLYDDEKGLSEVRKEKFPIINNETTFTEQKRVSGTNGFRDFETDSEAIGKGGIESEKGREITQDNDGSDDSSDLQGEQENAGNRGGFTIGSSNRGDAAENGDFEGENVNHKSNAIDDEDEETYKPKNNFIVNEAYELNGRDRETNGGKGGKETKEKEMENGEVGNVVGKHKLDTQNGDDGEELEENAENDTGIEQNVSDVGDNADIIGDEEKGDNEPQDGEQTTEKQIVKDSNEASINDGQPQEKKMKLGGELDEEQNDEAENDEAEDDNSSIDDVSDNEKDADYGLQTKGLDTKRESNLAKQREDEEKEKTTDLNESDTKELGLIEDSKNISTDVAESSPPPKLAYRLKGIDGSGKMTAKLSPPAILLLLKNNGGGTLSATLHISDDYITSINSTHVDIPSQNEAGVIIRVNPSVSEDAEIQGKVLVESNGGNETITITPQFLLNDNVLEKIKANFYSLFDPLILPIRIALSSWLTETQSKLLILFISALIFITFLSCFFCNCSKPSRGNYRYHYQAVENDFSGTSSKPMHGESKHSFSGKQSSTHGVSWDDWGDDWRSDGKEHPAGDVKKRNVFVRKTGASDDVKTPTKIDNDNFFDEALSNKMWESNDAFGGSPVHVGGGLSAKDGRVAEEGSASTPVGTKASPIFPGFNVRGMSKPAPAKPPTKASVSPVAHPRKKTGGKLVLAKGKGLVDDPTWDDWK